MQGSLLRSKRVRRGVTQEALATRLGITRHVISNVESDRLGLDTRTSQEWSAAIDDLARKDEADESHSVSASL